MKITFVSHASFIVKTGGVSIICDPWLTGKVFNEGWGILSKPFDVNFDEIDYIYISHEHPDHFNFPTLKSISGEAKKRITILYQDHASDRLVKAFKAMGFQNVLLLPLYQWMELKEGIKLYCGSIGSMDSFLAVKDQSQTILNLNDCVLKAKQLEYVKKEIGAINYLFTQFSFASWVGNESDTSNGASRKIDAIHTQKDILDPDYIIPFASFVYFCNEENKRMNGWINSPEYIYNLGIKGLEFMYPGDSIDTTNPAFDSSNAVKKYQYDLAHLKIDPTPPIVKFEVIIEAVKKHLIDYRKKIWSPFRWLIKPFSIYIHDIDKTITIDVNKNTVYESEKNNARFIMCSQMCWYIFNFPWGADSMEVSGMYLDKKYKEPVSRYFFFRNMTTTDFISFSKPYKIYRTLQFMWRKRWEIIYRFS
jgi:UDP-MurNAc hydroxylase